MGSSDSEEKKVQLDWSSLGKLNQRIAWLQHYKSRIKKLGLTQQLTMLSTRMQTMKGDNSLTQTDLNKAFEQIQLQVLQLEEKVHGAKFQLSNAEHIFQQLNLARTNPISFIPNIEGQIPLFEVGSKVLALPEKRILTKQGKSLWKETIDFLSIQAKRPTLPALQLNEALCRCAFQHLLDIKDRQFGHEGSNGSTAFQRISRFVEYKGLAGENLNEGTGEPRQIIKEMILDDGLRSRRDRLSIFESEYKQVGMYQMHGYCCICFIAGRK